MYYNISISIPISYSTVLLLVVPGVVASNFNSFHERSGSDLHNDKIVSFFVSFASNVFTAQSHKQSRPPIGVIIFLLSVVSSNQQNGLELTSVRIFLDSSDNESSDSVISNLIESKKDGRKPRVSK